MKRFPGKTLEELDQIDWLRFSRALEAERIAEIEQKRLDKLAGRISELSTEEWAAIAEHDEWLKED